MTDKQTAARKRQKIQDSNKMMFIWIAGASVIVGFAAVLCWFLWQQATFKMKVASAKEDTANVLKDNNAAVEELSKDILTLQTNAALLSSRATPDENAVQVILDALPADANPLALGASLQEKLITGVSGLELDGLNVEPVRSDSQGSSGQIRFSVSVAAGNPNTLTEFLRRLEKSIRVMDIEQVQVERRGNGYSMSFQAHAYYESEKELTLEEESLQ